MKVKDLIFKLEQCDPELPICIDDYLGFIELSEETIEVEQKEYLCFPFTEYDKFNYINLKTIGIGTF